MMERRETTLKLELVVLRDFESFEILKGIKVDVVCVVQDQANRALMNDLSSWNVSSLADAWCRDAKRVLDDRGIYWAQCWPRG